MATNQEVSQPTGLWARAKGWLTTVADFGGQLTTDLTFPLLVGEGVKKAVKYKLQSYPPAIQYVLSENAYVTAVVKARKYGSGPAWSGMKGAGKGLARVYFHFNPSSETDPQNPTDTPEAEKIAPVVDEDGFELLEKPQEETETEETETEETKTEETISYAKAATHYVIQKVAGISAAAAASVAARILVNKCFDTAFYLAMGGTPATFMGLAVYLVTNEVSKTTASYIMMHIAAAQAEKGVIPTLKFIADGSMYVVKQSGNFIKILVHPIEDGSEN